MKLHEYFVGIIRNTYDSFIGKESDTTNENVNAPSNTNQWAEGTVTEATKNGTILIADELNKSK